MKIIYKHGDLMQAPEPFMAQGCNAQGVMGSGVAKLIRDRWENVFTEYRRVYDSGGKHLDLGQTIWVSAKPYTIINCITQEFYGRDPNVVYVSYEGLGIAMESINRQLHPFNLEPQSVAMPLIGAGLANGKWSIISEIIETVSTNFQPVVYLIDGVIPDGVEGTIVPA
jgi:O-acetyl-ADP-ribose deacetylase (regulator of RNase III)